MLKAIKVLKNILNIADYGRYMEEQETINEAIKELKELNNSNCLNCIFAYRDKNKKIDDVQGQILGSKARWSYCKKLIINVTKDFYCNRYESKEVANA